MSDTESVAPGEAPSSNCSLIIAPAWFCVTPFHLYWMVSSIDVIFIQHTR